MSDYKTLIKDTVEKNKIALFLKGTPEMPRCGFSAQVVAILDELGLPYKSVNILDDHPNILYQLREAYGWPTSPQLFIDGELIGGCDIATELFESGDLHKKLGVQG